jgi:hypothetical protein
MLMSCHQNERQIHYINVHIKSFVNTKKFKYLKTTITNQNYIYYENQEQIKFREQLQTFSSEPTVILSPIWNLMIKIDKNI